MTGTPSLRRAVLVLCAFITLLATAGCVDLPANTTVSVVGGNPAKAGSGADVRIWPQAPRPDASAEQIVEDFLLTAASDPSNYSIARDYLTGEALSDWHPNRVVVFSDVSSPELESNVTPAGEVQVQISGTMVATVSDTGAYQPVLGPTKSPYTFDVSLDSAKHYRIDKLPASDFGILLTQETFRANYAAYYLYYLNQNAPGSSMIPVPDYQRSQTGDAVTAQNLLSALLAGPPDALSGIATLAAPQIELAGQVTIGPDETASVPIKSPSKCATQDKNTCELLADELLATFSSLGSVSKVVLADPQGNTLVGSAPMDSLASTYHIGVTATKNTSFYFLDSHSHQVSRYDSANPGSNPASADPLGPSNRRYSRLAIGGDAQQTYAAAVSDTGTSLYVSTLGSSKDTAPAFTGHRISSPTWDALGDLWFLDTAGASVSVYRLNMTEPKPAPQQVDVFGTGGDAITITGIAVAPDGVRIAVSYTEPGSAMDSVAIGVVEGSGSSLGVNLTFGVNQPATYHWSSLLDFCWHGSQALAVLGSPSSSSPLTISELNSDGSPVISAADLNPVTYTPPTGTTNIAWPGSVLLAATHSGTGSTAVQQIEQYSFTTGAWTPGAVGFSPTYVN